MKLAVCYDKDTDNISPDFENTNCFKVYDVDDGEITCSELVGTMGKKGSQDLTDFLLFLEVDALLCCDISEESCSMLDDESISFYSGFYGNADDIADGFIGGMFYFSP